jgi:hypothetical protein
MTGDAVVRAAERLTERTDTPGRGGGLRAWGVCVVASAGRLLLVVVGEFPVMFTDRVTDAARPVGVVQRAVERKPALLLVTFEEFLEVPVAGRSALLRLSTYQRCKGCAESVTFEVEGECDS